MPENKKRLARLAATHRVAYSIGTGVLLFVIIALVGVATGGSLVPTLLGGAGFGLALAVANLIIWRPGGRQARATQT